MSNKVISKRPKPGPNSKKWNSSGFGNRTGVTAAHIYERCHVCDFSPSNEESLYQDSIVGSARYTTKQQRKNNHCFVDPLTKKPICYRCYNAAQNTALEMTWLDGPEKEEQEKWENILDEFDLSIIDSDTQE